MADVTINNLPALTTPGATDVLPIVDQTGPTTKKITTTNLLTSSIVSVTSKVGTSSVNVAGTPATTVIPHGLGKTPVYVEIFYGQSNGTGSSYGKWDGTNYATVNDTGSGFVTNSSSIVYFKSGSSINSATVSVDSTNITLTWTWTWGTATYEGTFNVR